jgi:hypothetical protein
MKIIVPAGCLNPFEIVARKTSEVDLPKVCPIPLRCFSFRKPRNRLAYIPSHARACVGLVFYGLVLLEYQQCGRGRQVVLGSTQTDQISAFVENKTAKGCVTLMARQERLPRGFIRSRRVVTGEELIKKC